MDHKVTVPSSDILHRVRSYFASIERRTDELFRTLPLVFLSVNNCYPFNFCEVVRELNGQVKYVISQMMWHDYEVCLGIWNPSQVLQVFPMTHYLIESLEGGTAAHGSVDGTFHVQSVLTQQGNKRLSKCRWSVMYGKAMLLLLYFCIY